jgi:Xaa-Pro dipeptidase
MSGPCITRAVHFGPMSPVFRKQVEDTVWIENNMIAASKPGAAMKDIFVRTRQLYAEKGLPNEWTLHHQGGAQGYRNRDYLMFPASEEKIVEDQCICWNPTIAGPDYGTKSEDAFIARKNGPLFVTVPVIFPTISMKAGGIDFVRPSVLEL